MLSLRFIKIFYFARLKPLSIRRWQQLRCQSTIACGLLNKRFPCHCLLLTFLCDIYCNKMINSDKVCGFNERRIRANEKTWRHFSRKSKRKKRQNVLYEYLGPAGSINGNKCGFYWMVCLVLWISIRANGMCVCVSVCRCTLFGLPQITNAE